MKVAVFDSGIGGVTVLRALREKFPGLDFLYYGDTANVPYGTKSPAQIRRLGESAATFLKSKGADILVVACNTAACIAIDEIRRIMGPVPVFGVVEAGVEATAIAIESAAQPDCPILVLGTRATIRSQVYSKMLKMRLGGKITVLEQECPLLVPMIEEGWIDHPILRQTVAEYVKPHTSLRPGIALLACTHYPWIKGVFEKALPEWLVIESSEAIAAAMGSTVGENHRKTRESGSLEWQFSDPESVPRFIFSDNPASTSTP